MSNLTDLLPAGAGGKQVSFVASGTIGNGVTVGLNSDGTVSPVESKFSNSVVFESADIVGIGSAYDTNTNKIVVAYRDAGNSNYGTAVVGTVSGASISFGTPVVFESASSGSISVVFDSSNNKIVISYVDAGNGYYLTAIVGTVSGTSISFGPATVVASEFSQTPTSAFDSNSNKVVFTWAQLLASNNGRAVVGTVSGTSISFGTAVDTASGVNALFRGIVFDSVNNKIIITYRDNGNSNYGTAVVGTVSGTSISFGSPTAYSSASVVNTCVSFDVNAGKVVIVYQDSSNSNSGLGIVGTVSGTSIGFGSATSFNSIASTFTVNGATFDSNANKCIFVYRTANGHELVEATVSGTSVSFSEPNNFDSINDGNFSVTYDPDENKTVIPYRDTDNSDYGTSRLYDATKAGTADFIGITDAAISDTASGSVTIKGGIAANSGIKTPLVTTLGTASGFNLSGVIQYLAQAYDPVNSAFVVVSREGNIPNAQVGTVSGSTISYGAKNYPAGATNADTFSLTYDANAGKFVFVYQHVSNSYYGTAVVGTLSGGALTWGTPVVYASVNATENTVSYDASAQKVAIFYKDQTNFGNYGKALVGTVSGTSISFGSAITFAAVHAFRIRAAYDANAQKTVVVIENITDAKGTAYVATISGTNISVGTGVDFLGSGMKNNAISISYASDSQKVVVTYGVGNTGLAKVGTVSGTSISFGSETQFFNGDEAANYQSSAYNPSTGVIGITFNHAGTGVKLVTGTVSGADLSFGEVTDIAVGSGSTEATGMVYAANATKLVTLYNDPTNSNKGYSNAITTSDTLVPNTNYYVQTDGSLSTTVSSVLAGKALSSTSINLDYTT